MPGQTLSVELHIDHVASDADTVVANEAHSLVRGDETEFCGLLESVDDDGVGYLRLAPDCLVLLETDGFLEAGAWVAFSSPSAAIGIFGGIAPV